MNRYSTIVFLYSIDVCPYYVPGALIGSDIERSMKQAPCTLICNRLTEAIKLSFTNKFANVMISLKIKIIKF